jgi:hypothetical protein
MTYPHIHNRVKTISSKPLWIAKITMIKEKSGGLVAEVRIDVGRFLKADLSKHMPACGRRRSEEERRRLRFLREVEVAWRVRGILPHKAI